MNIEEIREYCISKPAVTEGFPFGQDVLVFKVMNKMFALTGLEDPEGSMSEYRFDTDAVHAGQEPDPTTGSVTPPIHMTMGWKVRNDSMSASVTPEL